MTDDYKKPFDKSYVLRVTAMHMLESIDISIGKTFERVKDFDGDIEKSREVFETLSDLHEVRRQVLTFQNSNLKAGN